MSAPGSSRRARNPTTREPLRRAGIMKTTASPQQARRVPAPTTQAIARTANEPGWDELTPRGAYARVGRPLFLSLLVLAGLPVALVLAAIIAPINWIAFRDHRQILFAQTRIGLRGRPFRIWKFRTMRSVSRGALESWSGGREDLRVTRFGRFLRSSHLDELPQILNILNGDMALIGPRPEMVEIEAWAGEHVPGFSKRLVICPGLTGLAQITQGYTGHDAGAYAQKLEINCDYLERMSFATDVKVVAKTIVWMARGRGWAWRKPSGSRSVPAAGSAVKTR